MTVPRHDFRKIRIRKIFRMLAWLIVLAGGLGSTVWGDTVFYSTNPGNAAYDDIGHTLRDVYGTDDLSDGAFAEVNYGLYQIGGTGPQNITMSFLYDDGNYTFSFGYFEVTSALQALPYNSVAEKEAWAVEALSTAQVVFVDRNAAFATPAGANKVVTDSDDLYTAASNDANRDHDTGSGDDYETINTNVVTLQGGSFYSFFIIPSNSLENFLGDFNDNGVFNTFAVNGSGASAWPLFAISEGNPGSGAGGSGDGYDQAFTFFGTTRDVNGDALSASSNGQFDPDPNSPGSVITFEDIWRASGDQDFNDLHFYIDNTNSTGIVVPEPSTWAAGFFLVALLGADAWRRWGQRKQRSVVAGI
jgi:hypothetical protein